MRFTTHKDKIQITVIQHSDEKYLPVLRCVEPNNREYCERYGFEYLTPIGDMVPKAITEKNRVYWHKLFYLESLLDGTEIQDRWFFLIDGDAAFIDHDIDLRLFPYLSPSNRELIACSVYANDMSWISWNVNAGILFIKDSEYMRAWLKDILRICRETNGAYIDQPVIQQMLRENYMKLAEHTSFFPSCSFNHWYGNFIYHPCHLTTCHYADAIAMKVEDLTRKVSEARAS